LRYVLNLSDAEVLVFLSEEASSMY
jgi:hypothetical protein